MNIKNILKIKLPFLFLFGVSLFLIFSDFVLLQCLKNNEKVLGVSKRVGVESSRGKSMGDIKSAKNNPDFGAHVSKVKNITLDLKKIAKEEVENEDIVEEVEDAADDISLSTVNNILPIEEVSDRPAWKSFLFGPDYKNLGAIRSNLVKTQNQIKNIEKTMEKNMGEEENNTLRARLGELEEERLTIFNYIDEKDDGFSLFGWLAKLMSGYNKNIEDDLDDVTEVVEDEDSDLNDGQEDDLDDDIDQGDDIDEVDDPDEDDEDDDTDDSDEDTDDDNSDEDGEENDESDDESENDSGADDSEDED